MKRSAEGEASQAHAGAGAADESVQQPAEPAPRASGVLRIKEQFRVKIAPGKPADAADAGAGAEADYGDDDAEAGDAKRQRGDDGGARGKGRHNKNRGMNKPKERKQMTPRDEVRLCPSVAQNIECPFGEKCKHSHDVAAYLAVKGEDLGERCPIYDLLGKCRFGLRCRFAKAHTDMDTFVQLVRSDNLHDEAEFVKNLHMRDVARGAKLKGVNKEKSTEFLKWWATESTRAMKEHEAAGQRNRAVREAKLAAAHAAAKSSEAAGDAAIEGAAIDDAAIDGGANDEAIKDDEAVSENGAAESRDPEHGAKLERIEAGAEGTQIPLRPTEKKVLNLRGKTYLAPLTTVGNLPFRRVCKGFGVDVTCSEMAIAKHLLEGGAQEWALMRRHESETLFGVQIAASHPETFTRCVEVLSEKGIEADFIDLNMGCPVDALTTRGSGSGLLERRTKVRGMLLGAVHVSKIPITVKMRMGLNNHRLVAHRLMPMMRDCGVSAITLHGRTKDQRYTKLADWDYTIRCAKAVVSRHTGGTGSIASSPAFFGNGDILSPQEYWGHIEAGRQALQRANEVDIDADVIAGAVGGEADALREEKALIDDGIDDDGSGESLFAGCMIGRGALIKPWLFSEIQTGKLYDISASERLEMLKKFTNHGLEHWGSDTLGVNTTRRFLCEWLSFLHRYVPVDLIEVLPQRMNERPQQFVGRNDLETLMASDNVKDWIKISEMLLGPAPESFVFLPKHKSNSYEPEG
nr:tRNA-dihydrouridine(47) synthase [NAD(P)(+)]-like protein [Polyrhizophydium stewartii]